MVNRVAVCDPLEMLRSGLQSALADADFLVDDPVDVVSWAGSMRSVVLSIDQPENDGVLDRITEGNEGTVVVALLDDRSPVNYRDALSRGATSAVPRHSTCGQVVDVVRAAVNHQALLPAEVTQQFCSHAPEPFAFSSDECEWLKMLAGGQSADEVAWTAGYSRRTMYRRLHKLYGRLGASRQTQALLEAKRRGIIA